MRTNEVTMRMMIATLLLATTVSSTGCGEEAAEAPEEEATETTTAEPTPEGPATDTATEVVDDGDTSLPGDPEAGAVVYAETCVACHAEDGRGNGGITGADLAGDPSRLAKGNSVLIHSISKGVLDANPPMPPHENILTDKQIRDALAYVRQTFGQQGEEAEPAAE